MQKNIYTISPQENFLKVLATYIFGLSKGDMLSFSRVRIILPNRRSVHKIKEYFVEISPRGGLILPEIISLGGIDEGEIEISASLRSKMYQQVKPAISGERRLLLLAKLVKEHGRIADMSFSAALKLAKSLGDLLDDVEKHELSFENIQNIIPAELAEHRQTSLDFIRFIFEEYPKLLDNLGYSDSARRTNQILKLYAEHLTESPPVGEVFIAGSTGSIPATRKLMKAILSLEKGRVILPYTDMQLSSFEWDEIGSDKNPISHQRHIQTLLKFLEVTRADIKLLDSKVGAREPLVSNIMRPATSIESWKSFKATPQDLNWIKLLEAKNNIHESKLIGTVIRHKVGQGLRTALITNNKDLAEKVEIYLTKFGIEADNSAGKTLDKSAEGRFLLSVAELISGNFRVVNLLAVLKSEYFNFINPAEIENFEINIIRKNNIHFLSPRPLASGSGLSPAINEILEKLHQILQKINPQNAEFSDLLKHAFDIINLSPRLNINGNEVWQKIEATLTNLPTSDFQLPTNLFTDCLKQIISGKKTWEKYKPGRKVVILSSQEARLQSFDVVILGDLTLGSWPSGKFSPWLSRRMYREMELPFEEDSISLSAHDFATHLHHKEVFISLSKYNSGDVAIESPFVTRVKTFYNEVTKTALANEADYTAHLESEQDVARKTYSPVYPRPPLEARFNRLSATQVEKLISNPYALYASKILGLNKLDDLELEAEAKDYGNYVHKILEEFSNHHKLDETKINHAEFMKVAEKVHKDFEGRNIAGATWLAQIREVAKWFVDIELNDVVNISKIISEASAQMSVDGFTLSAKADRIELTKDKKINIGDYKTGKFPSQNEVNRLISPQLLLEGYMIKHGAFDLGNRHCEEGTNLTKQSSSHSTTTASFQQKLESSHNDTLGYELGDIIYYNFSLANKGPAKKTYNEIDLEEKILAVESEFKNLIKDINDPQTPFLIRPNKELEPDFDDYEHLERIES
jgi:ATP-dependent helicase/nuclease subunit B